LRLDIRTSASWERSQASSGADQASMALRARSTSRFAQPTIRSASEGGISVMP
jgi:hypothetical protein